MRGRPPRIRDNAPSEKRHALVDPWLRRNVHFPGSAPGYAESPITRLWEAAEDSRADAAEKIASIREQHRDRQSAGIRWWPRRSAG